MEKSSLDEAVPGAIVAEVSRFEEYWGFPQLGPVADWSHESGPIPPRRQVKLEKVECQVKAPASRRRYFWRPELTNLTHEAKAERVYQVSPSKRAAKSPRRPLTVAKSASSERRASDGIHVRLYLAPNWFSAAGVAKKRKLIEAKGMPDLQGWRFITLTMNRRGMPQAAYRKDPGS